ncbi:hypothetical protein CANMA_002233 [Candida margitis]|uniref:uncharacterized protein n=1 Tax=Candida margitis TaxID=1775924 RepID=UPI002226B64E|nr:uncharacterized protein CANMA_002233 [Candida margitis]KAI5968797.1 hypothetical protein CANMA_002233 [Candida margitis]
MESKKQSNTTKHKIGLIVSPRLNMSGLMRKANPDDFDPFSRGKAKWTEPNSPMTRSSDEKTNIKIINSSTDATHPQMETNTLESPFSAKVNHKVTQNVTATPKAVFDEDARLGHIQRDMNVNSNCIYTGAIASRSVMTDESASDKSMRVTQEGDLDQFKPFSCFATPQLEPQAKLVRSKLNDVVEAGSITSSENNLKDVKGNSSRKRQKRTSFWRKQGDNFKPKLSISNIEDNNSPYLKETISKNNRFSFTGSQNFKVCTHENEATTFRGSQVFVTQAQGSSHDDDMISFIVAKNRLLADNKILEDNTAEAIPNLELSKRIGSKKPTKLRRLNQKLGQEGSSNESPKKYTYATQATNSWNSTYTNSIETSTFTDIADIPETPHTLAPQVSLASTDSLVSLFSHLKVSETTTHEAPIAKKSILRTYISRIKYLSKVLNRNHHVQYDFGPISLPKLYETSQTELNQLQTLDPRRRHNNTHDSGCGTVINRCHMTLAKRNFRKHIFRSSALGSSEYHDDRTRLRKLLMQTPSLDASVKLFEEYLNVTIT